MENRKGDKRILCVQCNSEFVRDGDEIRLKSQPAIGQALSTALPAAASTLPTTVPAMTPSAPTAPSNALPTPAPVTGQSLLEHIEEEPDDYGAFTC